jgi:putative hemolysin
MSTFDTISGPLSTVSGCFFGKAGYTSRQVRDSELLFEPHNDQLRRGHDLDFKETISRICQPTSVLYETEQYLIKLAETDQEVEKALRLRFEIFNLEQGKGLKSAEKTGIDRDEFDEFCFHLIVFEKKRERAVGTYRIHPGIVANSARGFYSAREYKITGLDRVAHETLEVGRSCVAPEFRTGAAVALLWCGIGELMGRAKLRYLFGCVSLETVDPVIGWSLHRHFQEAGKISLDISAVAQPEYVLEKPAEDEIRELMANHRLLLREIPPLFKGYLRLGSKICGEPALDREFGTIDYLIFLDTGQLPERYSRHFKYEFSEN